IHLCNPAMARILGLISVNDAAGRNLGDFYGDRTLWESHMKSLLDGEKVEAPLLELKSAAGNAVRVIARMLPHRAIDGATELEIYFTDISELHLIQKELAQTLAENRLLSQRYVAVQEAERRNLARELHDELGQCLNAIKLDAVSIRDVTHGTAPELEQSAISIIDISSHVYDVVRSMMQRLRPATLDALGLRDALAELISQWRRRNAAVDCAFEASGELSNLGEVTNITVYRLVQECLTNIGKHASATQVRIALHRYRTDEVSLIVRDNGRGMDLHARRAGLGLLGLRERVEALHGKLELISAPGAGMQIMAHIGIPSPQAE
ncbi:MAG: histidine kinase, partial [Betaproteobacteria bacterium]